MKPSRNAFLNNIPVINNFFTNNSFTIKKCELYNTPYNYIGFSGEICKNVINDIDPTMNKSLRIILLIDYLNFSLIEREHDLKIGMYYSNIKWSDFKLDRPYFKLNFGILDYCNNEYIINNYPLKYISSFGLKFNFNLFTEFNKITKLSEFITFINVYYKKLLNNLEIIKLKDDFK